MFKLTFKQQVLTGFVISLLFVLISAVTSYISIQLMNEDARWENHTYDVIDVAQEIELKLLNSETSLRGYIITQRAEYLDTYTKNIHQIIPKVKEIQRMTTDNPDQQQRLDSLELYSAQKVKDMEDILQTNTTLGKDSAVKMILTDKGRVFKTSLLRTNHDAIQAEKVLLKIRTDKRINSAIQSTIVVIISSVIIFGLILYLFTFIKRTFDEQKLTEITIRENNNQLEALSEQNKQKNWLLSGASAINESMRGEQEIDELSTHVITELCTYLSASVGALYLFNPKRQTLQLTGGYAYPEKKGKIKEIAIGEGLVGQAALEKRIKQIDEIPANYLKISSGLGNTAPNTIIVLPVLFEEEIIAVIELGLLTTPSEIISTFLNIITESIGVGINSAVARAQLRDLFMQTQQQAEELESQQEELRTTNEELIHKSEELQASEEELRVQQEELRQTNAELEEKANLLEERNMSVNEAREAMSLKAEELEVSSKYKSEFLANMSHELRTPLNSILILARILKENRPENLNDEQLKYAGVIHNAGSDLLTLINDILDLSKIESGKVDLNIEQVRPLEIKQNMESLFTEIAKSKKIAYQITLSPELPERMLTDLSRAEQIIKNLLSNAFKFTPEHGEIKLDISIADQQIKFYSDQLKNTNQQVISFSVKDSGIGIPSDKQKLIFEAFKQADGTTSRKYGGTGLGLSISKELANILGGEIQVRSEPGTGSCFTLYLPVIPDEQISGTPYELKQQQTAPVSIPFIAEAPALNPVNKNRKQTLLIVEDDLIFADVLKDYAIEKGFEPLLAHSGDTGLDMATTKLPDAIILDVMLPVMDGWNILNRLKSNPLTKHIPVHMMSAGEVRGEKALKEGAIGFLKKPIEEDQLDHAFSVLNSGHILYNFQTVLIIEDHELQSLAVKEQLVEKGIEVAQAFTGQEALKMLEDQTFDCIILDLNLPDISGFDLLDRIKTQDRFTHIPVIINTAMELDQDKIAHIMKYSEAMVLKSNKSNDRLIDEVSLFMNKLKKQDNFQTVKGTSKTKTVSTIEKALKGKTILITDDDMRNIFALSSALQVYDINIVIANNGREALEKLEETETIDLVLMDIMMPEMDGYEAMQTIREQKKYKKLPIIALTAKAMKNDREKCIEAGANDYIAKPVDIDQLLSMLRVWLS
ncbi:CheY-like chemotaxis protein/signal transduction histidine kinase/CHASE3 domain sensor protein [Pedobacter cryoconitis]|uniref:histidine kinase n=1 Tax=Pedobacter cryoconitis TaxID=188932 RepID=A0A7W9DY94_9SPHI|nr:response regulator [Pedobacter cryoconitis]MBB5635992.1 CheY-like chemotaxis protein/signal transduction histidine kinase/CHASE3 domain sensor protein [Pedobacter cryoconitis]MBB6273092.1 CheY-like chemotaxis protein/signal transduction histidine kinase/CHASE3 domain sensor protein [Pedobacter cryoconitis]